MRADDWQLDAACGATGHGLTPEAWTEVPQRRVSGDNARAMAVCIACPVFEQCDDMARGAEQWGIWAGRSHWDRYGREPRYDASPVRAGRSDKGKPRGGVA